MQSPFVLKKIICFAREDEILERQTGEKIFQVQRKRFRFAIWHEMLTTRTAILIKTIFATLTIARDEELCCKHDCFCTVCRD